MCRRALFSCTGYQFVTEFLLTNFAPWCTTFKLESLHVSWLILCSLPPPDGQLHHTSAAHQVRRAGSFSGPASWNSLPTDLRTVSDTSDFNKKLKTLSFKVSIWHSVDTIIFCFIVFDIYDANILWPRSRTVQGHPRSTVMVPLESPWAVSYLTFLWVQHRTSHCFWDIWCKNFVT